MREEAVQTSDFFCLHPRQIRGTRVSPWYRRKTKVMRAPQRTCTLEQRDLRLFEEADCALLRAYFARTSISTRSPTVAVTVPSACRAVAISAETSALRYSTSVA